MEPYRGRSTRFTERGLAVAHADSPARDATRAPPGFSDVDLFSGEMHYWLVDPARWKRALESVTSLGLSVVSTAIPWNVHEIRAGHHDFGGARDLGAFLDLVAEMGCFAVVRPGPLAGLEMTHAGLPRRIVEEPAHQARTARGTPAWLPVPPRMFPVPSYAARGFQDEVRTWLGAVGEVLAPRLWPNGPVVAVQVDNGAHMFFRMGAYDLDYHDDALAWWREFSGYDDAPRAWSPDDAERCIRWVHFKHEYTARALTWIGDALNAAGITDVARFHNAPPSDPEWTDLLRMETAAGLAGMDFHQSSPDPLTTRRRALFLAGSAKTLPFATQVGMGGPPWLPPPRPDQGPRHTLLTLLAAGVRGFNLYMAVDRDRWYGAPIDNQGRARPDTAWLSRLLRALGDVRFTALRRLTPVALVVSRTDAAFAAATSVADPITPVFLEYAGLGPAGATALSRDPDAPLHRRWTDACERALDLAQIPYHLVDEGLSLDRLAGYRAVIAPTMTRVSSQLWRTLHQLAERGVIVVIGPERPSLDRYGAPLDDPRPPAHAGVIQRPSLDDLSGLADDLSGIAGRLPDEWSADADDVDCALFVDPDERPAVFFVSNRLAQARRVTVVVPPGTALRDPIADETVDADPQGRAHIALPAHGIRMMRVA